MHNSTLEVLATELRSLREGSRLSRREFLGGLTLSGILATLALNACTPSGKEQIRAVTGAPVFTPPRFRAAFSYDGLKSTWSQRGSDTARFMGQLLGVDIVHYDGELSVDKQRKDLEDIAGQSWNFVAVHPSAVNAYVDPIRKIISKGIPVIDLDTKLVDDLGTLGITTFLEPDNIWMGEQVTQAIITAVGSPSFEIIHTQGKLTHTGAQGRAQGFHNVLTRYPGIKIVDETSGDWDIDRVGLLWDDLLARFPNVKAGFCHNDDMAMAALRSVTKAGRKGQVALGGVDGMQDACSAVEQGDLVATVLNPTGRIHSSAVWIGYFLASNGNQDQVPRFIRMDGGLINSNNAAGYIWMGNHLLL
ncbi:MAG: sugar ABC transporter substrate-binding protein [Anaerolineaceae bacterium]|nr:sugar ABC transporter substrate-binding protein [Anaerolineaceae bacterium]